MRRLSCGLLRSLASSASLRRLGYFSLGILRSPSFVIRVFILNDCIIFSLEYPLIAAFPPAPVLPYDSGTGPGQGKKARHLSGGAVESRSWRCRRDTLTRSGSDGAEPAKTMARKGKGSPGARPCEVKGDVIEGLQEDRRRTRGRRGRSWWRGRGWSVEAFAPITDASRLRALKGYGKNRLGGRLHRPEPT